MHTYHLQEDEWEESKTCIIYYDHPFIYLFLICYSSSNSAAQNNCLTRHLAKILIHLGWCLQELVTSSGVPSVALNNAINALRISSVFLKHLIENSKGNIYEELFLSVDGIEALPDSFPKGNTQYWCSILFYKNEELCCFLFVTVNIYHLRCIHK